jgi:putative restriction endonuclease
MRGTPKPVSEGYSGAGGRDPATGADQHFEAQNRALVKSEAEGFPVRVVRGAGGEAPFSPDKAYRYEGLFRKPSLAVHVLG